MCDFNKTFNLERRKDKLSVNNGFCNFFLPIHGEVPKLDGTLSGFTYGEAFYNDCLRVKYGHVYYIDDYERNSPNYILWSD